MTWVGVAHAPVSLVKTNVCLHEQRKQSFLTLAMENQSLLGLYRYPPTFLFTNSPFVLLIRDYWFVLISPLRISDVQLRHPVSSTRSGCEHKLDKSDYYVLNMDIFLRKKNTSIRYRRPLFTPQSHVRHFFIVDGCALLALFWTDEEKHPPIAL